MTKKKKKSSNSKIKIFKLLIILFLIYVIIHLYDLYQKIDSYKSDISYYETKIEELKKKQVELELVQNNVNSPEYIEKKARENLDMYYSNEKVFVDISK